MPTIKEVINRVELSGNIAVSIKYRWLGELDGKNYKYPDDADTELVFKTPDNLYDLYLKAMNDFFTGDMVNYSASAILFEQAYAERGVTYGRQSYR